MGKMDKLMLDTIHQYLVQGSDGRCEFLGTSIASQELPHGRYWKIVKRFYIIPSCRESDYYATWLNFKHCKSLFKIVENYSQEDSPLSTIFLDFSHRENHIDGSSICSETSLTFMDMLDNNKIINADLYCEYLRILKRALDIYVLYLFIERD